MFRYVPGERKVPVVLVWSRDQKNFRQKNLAVCRHGPLAIQARTRHTGLLPCVAAKRYLIDP